MRYIYYTSDDFWTWYTLSIVPWVLRDNPRYYFIYILSDGHFILVCVLLGVELTKKRHQHISPPANSEPPAGTSTGKTAEIEEAKKAKLEAEKLELAEFLEWL